jgi:hypothetical protein
MCDTCVKCDYYYTYFYCEYYFNYYEMGTQVVINVTSEL